MRPTGHIHSASIVLAILYGSMSEFQDYHAISFLLGSLIVDLDVLYSFLVERSSNHRMYLTHYPGFYFVLLLFSFYLNIAILYWFLVGILFHLMFDLFDWGLPLFPFVTDKITPHLLEKPSYANKEVLFFREYWSNKIIIFLEILLFIGFLLVIFSLPSQITLLIVVIDIFLTLEIIHNYKKLRFK